MFQKKKMEFPLGMEWNPMVKADNYQTDKNREETSNFYHFSLFINFIYIEHLSFIVPAINSGIYW